MKDIKTWKYRNHWVANRILADDRIITSYVANLYGTGKTKKEAINALCDALTALSEAVKDVVHEKNINE